MTFISTYLGLDAPCRWLRGNHHGHSTASDGADEPAAVVAAYEAAGYDYLALSEHDRLLPPAELQPRTSMCLLPAVEVTACSGQTLLYLGADRELPARRLIPRHIMEAAHAAGGLFVFDHPNWRPWPGYATDELLESMEGLRGMEIYTGVIERLEGEARATDRWDRLLSRGWRVFGHATDDQHEPGDYFVAWNCVQWPRDSAPEPRGIVEALREGRFYASTGVRIDRLGVSRDGAAIHLEAQADEIRWSIRGGAIVKKVAGGRSTLDLEEFRRLPGVPHQDPAQALYVRAECLGRGHAAAWSQPFWLAA